MCTLVVDCDDLMSLLLFHNAIIRIYFFRDQVLEYIDFSVVNYTITFVVYFHLACRMSHVNIEPLFSLPISLHPRPSALCPRPVAEAALDMVCDFVILCFLHHNPLYVLRLTLDI